MKSVMRQRLFSSCALFSLGQKLSGMDECSADFSAFTLHVFDQKALGVKYLQWIEQVRLFSKYTGTHFPYLPCSSSTECKESVAALQILEQSRFL